MKNYNGIKIQQLNDESWPIAAAEVVKPLFRIWKTMQGKCGRGNLGVAPAWESFRRFYEWASLEAPYTEEMELLFGSPEKDFFNTPSWRLKAKMSSNPASEIKEAGAFFVTKRLMEELMDVWVILSMVARGEDPYGEKPDFPAMLRMVNGNLARLQVEYDPAHATGLKAHLAKLVGLLEKQIPATEKLVIRPVITTLPEGLPTIASAGTPTPAAQSQDCWDHLLEIAEAIARACEYGGEDVTSEAIYNLYFELQDEYLWDHLQIRHWEYGTIREPLEDMVRGIESPEQRLNTIAAAVTAAATTTNRLADSQRRMEAELLERRLAELRHNRQLEELTTADATLRQLVMDNQAQATAEFAKIWETLQAAGEAMSTLSSAVHGIVEAMASEKRDRMMAFPTGVLKQAVAPPAKLNPLIEAVQAAAPQADAEAFKWVRPVIDKAVEPEAAVPVNQQEVVIIGLLGPQARDIEARLGDKFTFTFYGTDTKSQRLQNGCKDKVVVVMTSFMAHRTYEAVKKVAARIVHCNGGISALERDLTELYGSLTAIAA